MAETYINIETEQILTDVVNEEILVTVETIDGDLVEVTNQYMEVLVEPQQVLVEIAETYTVIGGGGGVIEDLAELIDRDGSNPDYIYVGRSVPLDTGGATWQIYRYQVSTKTSVFADGNENYDNIWDDRESLSYP
jgi:hypothetical protein